VGSLDAKARVQIKECLYLPIQIIPKPPFPKNNKEIFAFLKKIDPDYEEQAYQYLINNDYEGTIVISVRLTNTFLLASWHHRAPKTEVITKGFPPGRVPDKILKTRLALQKIRRVAVERVDGERLQGRIGNESTVLKDKRICIIGCGSLGSHIAFLLAKSGLEGFTLVDSEYLKPENISRHLCGMGEVSQPKVDAIRKRIQSHFPHIDIDAYDEKVHRAFIANPEILYDADLVVSAIGNTAIERRLNQIYLDSAKCPPILYAWIEPYGIASHSVLVVKSNGGCFDCCLDLSNLKYRFSVAEFEEPYPTLQEAGCQTSFTPYSALEAEQASSVAARLALNYMNGQITESTRYVWIGDLNPSSQVQMKADPFYQHLSAFSLHGFHVEKQAGCPQCSG
jgi:hypothetical protein